MPKTAISAGHDNQRAISEIRNQKVIKSNDLIQKSRFHLSLQEQKIILYLISKVKPNDNNFLLAEFDTTEFCNVCGIGRSGKNYADIASAIKLLADKSIWIPIDDKNKALLRWIDQTVINEKTGVVKVKLSDLLKPYLLQLHNNFTQFELLYTLAMKSRYSVRLYELLRSYEYKHTVVFDIGELKELVNAECYTNFTDFKRFVIATAVSEIEALSDINVTYEVIKNGRKYDKIIFSIKLKQDMDERFAAWKNIQAILDNKLIGE